MKQFIRTFVVVVLAMFCFFSTKTNADTYGEYKYIVLGDGIEITGGPDEGDIVIPDTIDSKPVVSIGDHAFYVSDITGVTIPESVAVLSDGAFKYCEKLKYVKFMGNGIEVIEKEAFESCDSLTSINLPTSIKKIESRVFVNCLSLPYMDLSKLSINSVGENMFYDCRKMSSLKLPDSVEMIPDSFCVGCDNLTTVVLGNKTTSIGDRAFSNNINLKTINFPDSLTSIGESAFYSCDSLSTITLPDSLKRIGNGAFRSSGLKTVYCSYNSYAYNYFKDTSVKVITGNQDIDNADKVNNTNNTNNTNKTKTKKYGGKRRLNHKKLNITLGFSKKLKLYNAKGKVKWKSSNKNIATVSKKGIIKAKKTGKVTIIGKNNGKKFKCKVKVYANKVNLPTNCSMDSGIGVSIYATSIEKYYNDYIVTYVVNNSSGHRLRNLDAVDCILLDSGNRFYQSKKVSFRYVPRTFKVKYKGLRKIDLRHASLNISSASYFKVYYYIN